MARTPTFREAEIYFPRESTYSTPPLATFPGGGGGFILVSAGISSAGLNALTFQDYNNISFGLLAGVITASASFPSFSQSVQTQNMVSVNGSTGPIVFANSNGVTFGGNAGTITASFSASQSFQPVYFSAQGGESAVNTLNFANSNGFTFINSNGSVVASYNSGAGTFTQSTQPMYFSAQGGSSAVGTLTFVNANGVSFSNNSGAIVASFSAAGAITDYLSVGQSTLFQAVSDNSLSLGTVYTSHTHAQYVNTSQSSLFQATSDNSLSLGTGYTTHTHSQYVNTSQSSLFQQTSQMTDYIGSAYTSHTHSQYINTSQSSLFQATSLMTDYLGTGYTTHTHGQYLNTSQSSLFRLTANDSQLQFTSAMSNYLGNTYTTHTHTNYVFSNSNNVSFGTNAGTVTASASFSQSVQTQNVHNLTISGNTSGVLAGISTGTLTLVGGNNITLSQVGNAITISGPNVGGAQTGISGISAGTTVMTSGTAIFSNSNGISFGLNGNTITASYTVPTQTAYVFSNSNNISFGTNGSTITASATFAQSNQSIGWYGLGNTTQNSSTTLDARSISLNALGAFTVGYTNGSIQMSAPATSSLSATGAVSISVNGGTISIGAPAQTAYVFSNSNGITFGTNGSTVTASVGGAAAGSISAGTASMALGQVVFSNSNGISFGLSGSTLTATVATAYLGTAATQSFRHTSADSQLQFTSANSNFLGSAYTSHTHTLGFYMSSQTTGQSSSNSVDHRSISFRGMGNISVGMSGNEIIISGSGAGGAGDGYNILAAGTQTANTSGTVLFANSNNFTFGMSNNSVITASYSVPTGQRTILGNTTAQSSASTFLSSYAFLGGVSGGWSSNSGLVISAPPVSTLSGTGQVSISTNGSTIFVGVPAAITRSFFEPNLNAEQMGGQVGQGSLIFQIASMPSVAFDRLAIPLHVTYNSSTGTICSLTLSYWVGLYTRNGSTLSLMHSTSISTSAAFSSNAQTAALSGPQQMTIPWTSTITEGDYIIGVVSRSTTAGSAIVAVSQWVVTQINSVYSGIWGATSNATDQWRPGVGFYSATTSGLPASVAYSQINGTNSLAQRPSVLRFMSNTF